MQVRYFVDGVEASQREANARWFASPTYRAANRRTRNEIWTNAHRGVDDGGVRNHLAEAGIEIRLGPTESDR